MILVDSLMACIPSRRWRWNQACHMFSDNLNELHAFAARLGLKREWFQNRKDFPHYDLTPAMRVKAVRMGAVQVGRDEVMKYVRARREAAGEAVCETPRLL